MFCQKSSMLTYAQPWSARPVATSASAAARTFSSETLPPNAFQLLQPIAGVSEIVSPTLMTSVFSSLPRAFSATMVSG